MVKEQWEKRINLSNRRKEDWLNWRGPLCLLLPFCLLAGHLWCCQNFTFHSPFLDTSSRRWVPSPAPRQGKPLLQMDRASKAAPSGRSLTLSTIIPVAS